MSFQKDQVVSFHYTVKNQDGIVVESSRGESPLAFISGQGQILPKLEEALSEMEINESRQVTLPPEDAYGEFRPDAVQVTNRSNFPSDTELQPGMQFWAGTDDGHQMPFTVKEVGEEKVTIDFNHPLAGQTLTFDIELIEVRPATPEELAHGHVHGPGGHHH